MTEPMPNDQNATPIKDQARDLIQAVKDEIAARLDQLLDELGALI